MAITYPLDLPTTIGIEEINLKAITAVGATESPFTFRQQIVRHQGERWGATVRIPPVKSANGGDAWVNFLVKLRGQYGTFLMGDPLKTSPSGVGGGSPVVDGGTYTGDELPVRSAPISTTGWLLAGDYIQVSSGSGARLYRVLSDVNTDPVGDATIDIFPKINSAFADGTPLLLSNPRGAFRLARNISDWTINSVTTYGIEFEAYSVVP